jgi:hypothetical protein
MLKIITLFQFIIPLLLLKYNIMFFADYLFLLEINVLEIRQKIWQEIKINIKNCSK